jgi:phosphatidate phosphatase LPIN
VIVQKSSLGLAWKWITVQSNVLVKGSLPAGVEVSLCRHLLKEHMGSEEAAEAFASVKVSLHEFKSNAASIIANDKLVIRVGGQYYPWSVAAPVVLGILTFGQVIMPATNGAIPMECPEPVPKSQAAVGTIVPAARGGWNLWPFPLRRPKTPEQSIVPNPLVSRDTLLVAAGTAVQSPFVNDLMLQNAYYERPRRSKVRTIIPTSQMLAQMNLKEGNNRITFTFFTRMLGNQQVDARVYLWKWNTRIVISDVDGTITKSDVLGQVMPLVGKDWTQSGVARLFSAIKENGYELLFLSARAISQADLTRQFLFNVKQDGETLPDGPVVISPDGLFPSLYREGLLRFSSFL